MTTKDILVGFGGIDSDLVLAAAPSEKFLKEKRVKNAPADRQTSRFIKLGAIAAAIVLMICSVPMLLDLTPSDDFVAESYTEVLAECDLAVFGTYKSKTEKLTYSEYTFEVTEVLKGEVTQKEITVRSEKKSIFSEDEMEKHAQSVNASFEEGNEYFLTLQGEGEKVIEFLTEQIVNTADLASANLSDDLRRFLEENGVTIETSREDLAKFFKYIFGGLNANKNEHFTNDLNFTLDPSKSYYIISKYYGEAENVVIPGVYNGLDVKIIESGAFENCEIIKSLVISENVERIDSYAFRNCRNLQTISIPNSLRTIGVSVFENCTSLQYYSEKGINYLGCDINKKIILMSVNSNTLSYIGIDDATKIIYDSAFKDCKDLERVKLPKNLSCLCKDSFRNGRGISFTYNGTSSKWYNIERFQWVDSFSYGGHQVKCSDCLIMW